MSNRMLQIDVDDLLKDVDGLEELLLSEFAAIGEYAVNEARSKVKDNDWHDVTGNLRASIGYVVLLDGKVVVDGQPQGGGEGVSQGRSLLTSLRSQYPRGLVLIVSAGMSYASYVEARGYNVLTSAEQKAEVLVEQLLNDLRHA